MTRKTPFRRRPAFVEANPQWVGTSTRLSLHEAVAACFSRQSAVWAVADQAAVSLGTFLTSIALARRLSPSDYGVYAAVVAALLFFNGVHGSLVTSPLSVRGAAAGAAGLARHATASLLFTGALAVLGGLALAGVFGGMGGGALWLWAPAALAAWQLQETVRRSLMCGLGHRRAVWGDAVSYLGQSAVFWLGWRAGWMTLGRAFAVMALTSGAAAAMQAAQAGLGRVDLAEVRALARDYWKFGSWLLYGTFASVFSVQAFYWVLAWTHGAKETASLQAVWNALGVCHPLMFGLGNLLVPVVSRVKAAEGMAAAWRAALRHGGQFGAALAAYLLALLVWPGAALALLYGAGSPYTALSGALRLMVAAYALTYLAQVMGLFLTGVGDSRASFRVQLAGAAGSILAGLPMAVAGGTAGACAGLVVVNAARSVAAVVHANRARLAGFEVPVVRVPDEGARRAAAAAGGAAS